MVPSNTAPKCNTYQLQDVYSILFIRVQWLGCVDLGREGDIIAVCCHWYVLP